MVGCVSWALVACRGRCGVDELLLLTVQPLQLEASGQLEEPGLHALVLVERMEPDPIAKHLRIVHAQINLTNASAAPGVLPAMHEASIGVQSWSLYQCRLDQSG